MPLLSSCRTFWKRYRLWLLGALVCGWSVGIAVAWWLMESAGHTGNGVQEVVSIGALPVT